MTSLIIIGKRWFHRGPGNTYFSATAYIDGKAVAHIDYEYGYGNQYEWSMFAKLERDGLLPFTVHHYTSGSTEAPFRWAERHGINYTTEVSDVRRKKDL